MTFLDRRDAGRQLAVRVAALELADPVVLGLPRGGVPVAYEVANAIGARLEVFVARKVGAPGHEELGVGAIAEGSDEVTVGTAASAVGVGRRELDELARRERPELERRVEQYRGGEALPVLAGRDVVVVDDGLATGVTAEATLRSLRRQQPRRLVLAVPVCAPETRDRLAAVADEVVCVVAPDGFGAVGSWYADFTQTTDDEVIALLRR